MQWGRIRHIGAIPASVVLLVGALSGSAMLAGNTEPNPLGEQGPVQAEAAANVNVSGLWEFSGVVVQLEQVGATVTSKVITHECTGATWEEYITADVVGDELTGTMHRCDADTHPLVADCHFPQLWDTSFEANASRVEISGTYEGEWVVDCRVDHAIAQDVSGTRLDCRPLSFDELALEHPTGADQVALATQFENGLTLHWTDEQVANGFKARAEAFVEEMATWGFPGRINSAFRPLLYQAHFADLRKCGLTLIAALRTYGHDPAVATAIGKSVALVQAEVRKHAIKSEVTTVAGQSVPVPFVCWREPLENCPHVDGRAIDVSFAQIDPLDWVGAVNGWCRRYLPQDPPHWEEISEGRCGQQYGPGRADIDITVESPVAILLTDGSGRRLGHDPTTGTTVDDFGEGSYYTGPDTEPQRLYAVGAMPGEDINVTLTATGTGPYKIRIVSLADDGIDWSEVVEEGQAELGRPIDSKGYAFAAVSGEPMLHPPATEIAAQDGAAQTFEATLADGSAVVSVTPPVAESVHVNSARGAVGIRLADGASGDVAVTVPTDVVGTSVQVFVDGREVTASVEDRGQGRATVQFVAPASASAIEIRGATATASGDGPPIVAAIVVVLLAVGLVAAFLFSRRRSEERR